MWALIMKKLFKYMDKDASFFMWSMFGGIIAIQFLMPVENLTKNIFLLDGILLGWFAQGVKGVIFSGKNEKDQ